MDREVVDPNHEDGNVDRKNAEHEDKNGMGVVVEIIISFRSLGRRCQQANWRVSMMLQRLTLSCALREARTHVASWTIQATR